MKNWIFMLLVTLVAANSWAEGGANGGKGCGLLICKHPDTTALTYPVLDLYEAGIDLEKPGAVPFPRMSAPGWGVSSEIERALERLKAFNPGIAEKTREMIAHARAVRTPVPEGKSLPPPPDTSLDYLDGRCSLVGLGRYNDAKDILEVDNEHFSHLTPMNEAAFWVHEGFYKVLRDAGIAKDSVGTRKVVGYLFSEDPSPTQEVLSWMTYFKVFSCDLPNTQTWDPRDRFLDHYELLLRTPLNSRDVSAFALWRKDVDLSLKNTSWDFPAMLWAKGLIWNFEIWGSSKSVEGLYHGVATLKGDRESPVLVVSSRYRGPSPTYQCRELGQ